MPDTAEHIIGLERAALDRWGKGDPSGFLEVYGDAITYFDPLPAQRIDGRQAMADYYRPWTWSFTRHPAFETMTAEATEGLNG